MQFADIMKLDSCPYRQPWTTDSSESIWGYLIQHGHIKPIERTKSCLEAIKNIGVNWDNTRMPRIFERLSGDMEREIILSGSMIMNDWTWYNWEYTIEPPNTVLNSRITLEAVIEAKLKELE